ATPEARERLRGLSPVVAADGGAAHAQALGVRLDLWVGDFDSSPGPLQLGLAGVPRRVHPRDKAQVDTELALDAARDLGATGAVIAGALGGRFDHALATVLVAARATERGFPVVLDSGDERAYPVVPSRPLTLDLEAGATFSVLALSGAAEAVTVTGARWPLDGVTLERGLGWGVSNEAAGGRLDVSCAAGLLLVIVQDAPV
ncbi:MAG TPA: thiamine diphosphokinase, partial [Deinococcales bacterium]|nr:thiamine diphosphokinase [Deinococcales bacterium]